MSAEEAQAYHKMGWAMLGFCAVILWIYLPVYYARATTWRPWQIAAWYLTPFVLGLTWLFTR